MTNLSFTPEEKKRLNQTAIRTLIKAAEDNLRNPYRNDHEEIRQELDALRQLLQEVKEDA